MYILEIGPEISDKNGNSRYEWVILAYESTIYNVLVRNLNDFKRFRNEIWSKLSSHNSAVVNLKKLKLLREVDYMSCKYSPFIYNGFGLFASDKKSGFSIDYSTF